jgi:hypothetical protein
MKILLLVVVALLLSVDLSARDMVEEHYNRTDQGEFEFDDSDSIWQEQASQVPPVSTDALKPLKIDHGPQGMTFFIDQKSISMNRTDRVTRYWLAAKNGGRIVSLNFEALRCSTREYKLIAYARPGQPERIRRDDTPQWRKIGSRANRDYHAEIADDYICAGTTPKTYEGVVSSLKGNYDSFNPYSEYTDH